MLIGVVPPDKDQKRDETIPNIKYVYTEHGDGGSYCQGLPVSLL